MNSISLILVPEVGLELLALQERVNKGLPAVLSESVFKSVLEVYYNN
jgi:hypothetical protein